MPDTFRLPEYDAWLDFQEGPWTGSRVRVRLAAPLGLYFDTWEALESPEIRVLRAGLSTWADACLIEWNLTDHDGAPIPATAAGLESVPARGAMMIVRAWLNKAPEVEPPLASPSPDGVTSGD